MRLRGIWRGFLSFVEKLYKRVTPIGCPGVRLAVGFCPLPPTRSLRSPAICNRRLSCPRSQNPAFSPLVAAVLLIHLTLLPASFSKFGLGTASNSAHSRSVSNLGLRIWVLGKPGDTELSFARIITYRLYSRWKLCWGTLRILGFVISLSIFL